MTLNGSMRLIFAFEDEIGQSKQRAGVVRIAVAARVTVDTSLGPARVVMGQAAGTIERTGVVHQRHNRFRLDADEILFFQHSSHQLAGVAVAVFHRVDQRKRDFSLLQVAQHRLAELLCGGCEIKEIIHHLEGQSRITAVIGNGLFGLTAPAAKYGAQARATAEQACGLVSRQRQRVVLGHIHTADFRQLDQLAFYHLSREFDQNVEDAEVALFERHLERLHVEPVAREHAAVIAPAGVGRRPAAAGVGAVDHVIVDQRRAVQKLDHRRKMDGALPIGAGITVGKEQQGGSQALPSSAEKIAGDFADRLEGSRTLAGKLLFNQDQVIADKVEDFLDGQERDGRSSTRRYWAKRYARKSGIRPRSFVRATCQTARGEAIPKNRLKLDAVVAAISSGGKFLTFASAFATSHT